MKPRLTLALAALTVLAFGAGVSAQDMPAPSPKLASFQPLVGKWVGKGTAAPSEAAQPSPWTATIEFRPILDGFFFQEDTEVHVGAPTPLQMRAIYGWDQENQRYVGYGTGNRGRSDLGSVHFPDRNTMVLGFVGEEDGVAMVSRSIWTWKGDALTFRAESCRDAKPWSTEVEGTFERVDTLPEHADEASFMNAPVSSEMQRIASRMAGTYDVTGAMTMAPGTPEMKISGTETMTRMFDGHVLFSRVLGTAEGMPPYVGETYVTFNPTDHCYDFVMFSNMGEVAKTQCWFTDDDTIIGINAGSMMGTPVAQRMVMKLGPKGVASASNDTLMGAAPAMRSFSAKYVRKAD